MSDNKHKYAVQSFCFYVDNIEVARDIARDIRSMARVKAVTQFYRNTLLGGMHNLLVVHIDNGTGKDITPRLEEMEGVKAFPFTERCTEGYKLERWSEKALELVTYRYGSVMTRRYI